MCGPASSDDSEFNWNGEAPEVVQAQSRTALYLNPMGQAVIRQERDWNMEEDSFVVFNIESAGVVVRELSLLLIEAAESGLTLRQVRGLIAQFQRIEHQLQEVPA